MPGVEASVVPMMTVSRLGRLTALALCLLVGQINSSVAEPIWVGRFGEGDTALPAPWKIERLNDKISPTRYGIRRWDGVMAIEAHASNSMALLGRPLTVDLKTTPILCWQWRIDATVASADMDRKSGDDYAARVYLTFAVPSEELSLAVRAKLRIARSIYGSQVPDAAINYVWDNRKPVGTLQDNAYTDRARMLVLRTGNARAGAWVAEQRDVARDFQRAFPGASGQVTGLAIASDTDNTGGQAHAGFADFRFVARADECPAASRE